MLGIFAIFQSDCGLVVWVTDSRIAPYGHYLILWMWGISSSVIWLWFCCMETTDLIMVKILF